MKKLKFAKTLKHLYNVTVQPKCSYNPSYYMLIFRYQFIIFLFILNNSVIQAQFQEVGLGVGGALYYGDLSPDAITDNLKLVKPAIGLYFNNHFDQRLAIKASLTQLVLSGDDRYGKPSIRERNLSFRSNVWELSISGEYYLVPFDPYEGKNFGLYGAIGVALMRHNPKTWYGGQWYALQPLSTEGQGLADYPGTKPYSLLQFTIPITGGFKYAINEQINLFLEFGPRITFTDYLDDVSTEYPSEAALRAAKGDIAVSLSFRGNEIITEPIEFPEHATRGGSDVKDYYFNGLIGISISLEDIFGTAFRKVRCPKF